MSLPGYIKIFIGGVQAATGGSGSIAWNAIGAFDSVGVGSVCVQNLDGGTDCAQSSTGQGLIQDLRFYNRELTDTEILQLSQGTCGGGDTGDPSFTATGNVTFLLAKGNVTTADITDALQTTIKSDIATALGITEADRVFIDQIKASPRRDKEVNMVVHVEHDDNDRDSIAGKTADVADAVKTTLNDSGLNVCGCNAASLVDSEIQTSINC